MSRSRSRTQDHDVRLSHWSAVHLALPRRTRNPPARCCVEPSVTRGGAASGTFMDRTHTRAPTRTRIKISARTRDYLDGSPDGAGARPPSATCGGALCLATRNRRILFSFGNWIAVCADHSCREGIRCRMPDFHPPSMSEFQPLIVRSRTTRFFGLPGRAGQPRTRTEDHRSKETVLGRIRLPESHLLSFSLIFWLGKAEIGAAARLRQPATTAFRRHLPHDGGRDAKRPIYTSVRMLKTRPKTCHFLPLFAPRGAQKRAEASHRISNRRWRIGTGRCVVRRCQKKSGKYTRKSGTIRPRCCSLCLESGSQDGGWRAEDGNQEHE
jgi:hypothetical protein